MTVILNHRTAPRRRKATGAYRRPRTLTGAPTARHRAGTTLVPTERGRAVLATTAGTVLMTLLVVVLPTLERAL